MRAHASIKLLWIGAAALGCVAAAGCTSPTKRQYLHHLSVTIPPARSNDRIVALFDEDRAFDESGTALAIAEEE